MEGNPQCPRCTGWLVQAVLEGKDQRRWQVIPCRRCWNCGWYGGESILDRHLAWADSWLFA
jgi:hypothetical protein